MNAKLRLMGNDKLDRLSVPIASATVISPGDLISYESNLATKLNAATDDATFVGVAESQSKAGETEPINVIRRGIFEVPVESAAYTIGQALAWNSSNDTLEASTANTIAWANESTGGVNVVSLKVLIDVINLNKLFAVNA